MSKLKIIGQKFENKKCKWHIKNRRGSRFKSDTTLFIVYHLEQRERQRFTPKFAQ